MNLRRLIWPLSALLVIVVALPLAVYGISEEKLSFETVTRQTDYGENLNSSVQIIILRDRPLIPLVGISDYDQALVQDIDYTQYFAILVFFGSGSSVQDYISGITQFKNDVWVKASIQTPSPGATYSSSYQIVKIPRTQLQGSGKISFILLNSLYEEKARTVSILGAEG